MDARENVNPRFSENLRPGMCFCVFRQVSNVRRRSETILTLMKGLYRHLEGTYSLHLQKGVEHSEVNPDLEVFLGSSESAD